MNRARSIVSFGSGVVFALGLAISQMTNPNKVLSFLDVFGDWDPSLALVMGAALGLNLFLFRKILARPRPALDVRFHMPPTTIVDHKLVLGSALFGLGWGIAGYCPGAAIAAIGSGSSAVLVFLGATGAGMALYRGFEDAAAPEPEPAAAE